jgi:hypothetical protein
MPVENGDGRAPAPPVIHPTAVYTPEQLRDALRLNLTSIDREVRLGRLKCAMRCGRRWILGRWALQWLAGGRVVRGKRRAEAAGE